jgi:hypothetical protein
MVMSSPAVSSHRELLEEISLHSRSNSILRYQKTIDEIFSREFSKEELMERISWLSTSFYPGALQKVIGICIRLFKKHIGAIPSFFDEYYHLNVIGIREIVIEIAKNKGVEFPIYSCNKESLDDFFRSELPYAGFISVDHRLHYTPIFIEKNLSTGKYNIVITDSLGNFSLVEFFAAYVDVTLIDSIYVSLVRRQNDSDSCGIFAIRDFSKWMDHIKSGVLVSSKLESFVTSQSPYYSLIPVLQMHNLPEEFLRSAQSITLTSLSKDKATLAKFIHKNEKGYFVNCKMERYHVKCLLRILRKIF